MTYNKTNWVDGVTPVSAQNMNNLETQYEKAKADLDAHKADNAAQHRILIRDILRIKLRQSGLNLDPNAWSDTLEDGAGIDQSASAGYYLNEEKISKDYTLDLTSGGSPISGGAGGGKPPSNAFDNDTDTEWWSSQTGSAVSGTAYIGYDFGAGNEKSINRCTIQQIIGATARTINSVRIQYSHNGVDWVLVTTASLTKSNNPPKETISFTNSVSARYWRILANANPDSAYTWSVAEIEFMSVVPDGECYIVWKPQTSEGLIKTAIVEAIEELNNGTIDYYISRDSGNTYTLCPLGTPTDITSQSPGTAVVLKAVINGYAELLAVAWGGEI